MNCFVSGLKGNSYNLTRCRIFNLNSATKALCNKGKTDKKNYGNLNAYTVKIDGKPSSQSLKITEKKNDFPSVFIIPAKNIDCFINFNKINALVLRRGITFQTKKDLTSSEKISYYIGRIIRSLTIDLIGLAFYPIAIVINMISTSMLYKSLRKNKIKEYEKAKNDKTFFYKTNFISNHSKKGIRKWCMWINEKLSFSLKAPTRIARNLKILGPDDLLFLSSPLLSNDFFKNTEKYDVF